MKLHLRFAFIYHWDGLVFRICIFVCFALLCLFGFWFTGFLIRYQFLLFFFFLSHTHFSSLSLSFISCTHIDRFRPMEMSHNPYWALHRPSMIEESICHVELSMHRFPIRAPKTVGNWTFIVSVHVQLQIDRIVFIAKLSCVNIWNELNAKHIHIHSSQSLVQFPLTYSNCLRRANHTMDFIGYSIELFAIFFFLFSFFHSLSLYFVFLASTQATHFLRFYSILCSILSLWFKLNFINNVLENSEGNKYTTGMQKKQRR